MAQRTPQDAVAHYYSRLGSRLGYRIFLGRSQHFGLYDAKHRTEPQAQINFHEHLARLLDLAPGQSVLDAGCGQGVVATYLASHHGVHVTGITITPHEIKTAAKLARQQGVAELTHFQLADYADPPFADASFDRVYTTETLSHAVDVQAVLEQFYRVLKPGGKLVCAEYEFDYEKFGPGQHRGADFARKYAAIHGIYQFAKDQFPGRLTALGFTDIHETDWTEGVKPSFKRLEKFAVPLATAAKAVRLERFFVNTMAARMYGDAQAIGAFRFKVYEAVKPV